MKKKSIIILIVLWVIFITMTIIKFYYLDIEKHADGLTCKSAEAYYSILKNIENKYGKATLIKSEYIEVQTGLLYARLVDFKGTGDVQLYLIYGCKKNHNEDIQIEQIWDYTSNVAHLIYEEVYSIANYRDLIKSSFIQIGNKTYLMYSKSWFNTDSGYESVMIKGIKNEEFKDIIEYSMSNKTFLIFKDDIKYNYDEILKISENAKKNGEFLPNKLCNLLSCGNLENFCLESFKKNESSMILSIAEYKVIEDEKNMYFTSKKDAKIAINKCLNQKNRYLIMDMLNGNMYNLYDTIFWQNENNIYIDEPLKTALETLEQLEFVINNAQ